MEESTANRPEPTYQRNIIAPVARPIVIAPRGRTTFMTAAAPVPSAAVTPPTPTPNPAPQPVPGLTMQDVYRPVSTVEPAAAQPPQIVKPPKKRLLASKKAIIIAVAVAGSLLALGGGASALVGRASSSPNAILLTALVNNLSAKSQTVSATIGRVDATTTLNGTLAQNGVFSVSAATTLHGTALSADALSPDGKNMYFRINGFTDLAANKTVMNSQSDPSLLMQVYGPLLTSMDGTWYTKPSRPVRLDESDVAQIKELYAANPFLAVTKTYDMQTVNGELSYHYQVTITGAKLKNFLIGCKDAQVANMALPQDELSLLNDTLTSGNLASYPVDVWVAKKTAYINQIALNAAGTSLSAQFGNFDQPVSIAAPSGAKAITSLQTQLKTMDTKNKLYSSGVVGGGASALLPIILP